MLTYTDALEDGTVEEVHEEGESFTEKVRKSDPFKIIKLPLALIGIELASLWIVLTLVLHRDYYLRPFPLNSISKDFLTEKSAPTPTDINKTILEIQYRTQTYVPWELIGEENTAYSVPNDADTWTTLNTSTMVHWRKDGKGGESNCATNRECILEGCKACDLLKGDSCNCATYDGAAVGVHNVLGVEMIRIIGLHSTLVLNMNATIVAKTTALVATLLYLFASVLYLLRFNIGAPVKVDFQYHHSWDHENRLFTMFTTCKASLNLWPMCACCEPHAHPNDPSNVSLCILCGLHLHVTRALFLRTGERSLLSVQC